MCVERCRYGMFAYMNGQNDDLFYRHFTTGMHLSLNMYMNWMNQNRKKTFRKIPFEMFIACFTLGNDLRMDAVWFRFEIGPPQKTLISIKLCP